MAGEGGRTVAEPEDLGLVLLDGGLDLGEGEDLAPRPLDAADLRAVARRHVAVPLAKVAVDACQVDVPWRGPARRGRVTATCWPENDAVVTYRFATAASHAADPVPETGIVNIFSVCQTYLRSCFRSSTMLMNAGSKWPI